MFSSLFFRIIVISILALALVLVLLDELYIEGIEHDEWNNTKGINQIVIIDIYKGQDKVKRLNYWSELFNYQFSLKSVDEILLSKAHYKELLSNGVYIEVLSGWTSDDVALYYYHTMCNCILKMEKKYPINGVWLTYIQLFFIILFFILAFFIFRYSNGHKNQVNQLTRIYDLYGRENFKVRTNTDVPEPYSTLAKTFNQMAERIEFLLQDQKILVHGVSHDIRTPIARLRFALDMTRGCNSISDYQEKLQDMDEDLDDLDGLVNEWLFYAELTGKTIIMKEERFDLQQKTIEIMDRISKIHPLIQLNSSTEKVIINGDIRLLNRAIENIIMNAFKFTKTTVRITLKNHGSEIFLGIEDDGMGVPMYLSTQIFQPFVKQYNNEQQTAGFGLGLAIAKNIFDKHHAKLSINTSKLGGAFFSISFK